MTMSCATMQWRAPLWNCETNSFVWRIKRRVTKIYSGSVGKMYNWLLFNAVKLVKRAAKARKTWNSCLQHAVRLETSGAWTEFWLGIRVMPVGADRTGSLPGCSPGSRDWVPQQQHDWLALVFSCMPLPHSGLWISPLMPIREISKG